MQAHPCGLGVGGTALFIAPSPPGTHELILTLGWGILPQTPLWGGGNEQGLLAASPCTAPA